MTRPNQARVEDTSLNEAFAQGFAESLPVEEDDGPGPLFKIAFFVNGSKTSEALSTTWVEAASMVENHLLEFGEGSQVVITVIIRTQGSTPLPELSEGEQVAGSE